MKRKTAQEKVQEAAELIKEADARQKLAKEDVTDVFPQYQAAKKDFQETRTNFLKLLKSLLTLRGSTAASLMASFLPDLLLCSFVSELVFCPSLVVVEA